MPQNTVCLLKTAITTVRNGTNSIKANVLFDEGSQRSFIAEELANTLAVQSYRKEDITVSSFEAQCQLNRQVNVAVVNLITMTGQSIPLTVLVVPPDCHTITEHSDI